ncbi:hypothetical protein GCM10010420_23980 [Streptomyces glaucosporus]|uniref:Putative T7SS secretion signal domain-containing protein n=1 Tax=Streptomyces glaucosporus TaxID=284044 RepID=A0ABN3I804_9ACTN
MSAEDFPTIGFDPAPGKLSSIDDLTEKLSKTADGLKKAHDTLVEIGKSGGQGSAWEGEAAEAFSKKVGELPKYLDDSHDALSKAAKHLKDWRARLAEYQETARDYEARAKAAKDRQTAAEAERSKAVTAYDSAANDPALGYAGQIYTDQDALNKAQARYDAAADRLRRAGDALDTATGKVEKAKEELEALIKKAEDLLEEHQDCARRIASRLRKANGNAPDTGFFESVADAFKKLGNKFQEWCEEHADLLKTIGDWLSIASTALGILALATVWFPPLSGALALAGGVTSLGALATHGAAKYGGADIKASTLIFDGIGVLPFGKLVKGVSTGVKVGLKFGKHGDLMLKGANTFTKVADAAPAGTKLTLSPGKFSRLGGADDVAKFTPKGFGNRVNLAWTAHMAETTETSVKGTLYGTALTKTPLRSLPGLEDAIRADGTLDPLSWWSRGPQMGGDLLTGSIKVADVVTPDPPAAGTR